MTIRMGCLLALLCAGVGFATPAAAAQGGKACTATAKALLQGCRAEGTDSFAKANAICLNESTADQPACFAAAKADRSDHAGECQDQFDARTQLCDTLGEEPYDPSFAPASFVSDYAHPGVSNPYLPLHIGNSWDFVSQTETDHVEVTSDTKLIDGITCLVVSDRVHQGDDLTEDANDWMALALTGDVWYCGEESKSFESTVGDQPKKPELVSIDGSFKAGRDGDKPGILALAAPTPGRLFRQEFSVGNAEDVVEVLATNYVFGQDPELDMLVPQALADHLCGAGCVVTRDFSPLEPDVVEHKYYSPGIGVFLETDVDTGEVNRLVDCNFDARCDTLPQP